ncbi:vacuolar sorting-associated protein [Puccinia sorghi]|uniref:Vacuolar sorting-associated protein n=1 Tax=Puccinia sorghi TaxID=27349 RepID=A0A0L6U6P1_9BASI|nr:vacuolar sorting-associated protein [Puccinia sorghi]
MSTETIQQNSNSSTQRSQQQQLTTPHSDHPIHQEQADPHTEANAHQQPLQSLSPTRSQSEISTLSITSRNRASSWSIFRRNSIPNDLPDSLPSSLLSRLTTTPSQPSPHPISAPLSGPASTTTHQTHSSTGSGSFSLSSLASALKRPLNLATAPSPSTPSPSQHQSPPQSPSDTKLSHVLSSKDADPDPTPSVPPRLVVESPSEETPPVPFDFNLFLDQMRWPQAQPIAKYLRSFLKEFTKRANHPSNHTSVSEQVKVVNDFLDFISIKMREIPDGPWDPRTCNDAEFDNAVEAMEKLVMNRVWHLTFTPALSTPQPSQTDDLERDTVLSQKMNLFSWVTDRHLDLKLPEDEADGFLEFAKTELLKINSYKAPRDKMICILNCCKVIFGVCVCVCVCQHRLLDRSKLTSILAVVPSPGLIRHIDQSEGGADTFIPILILVVLRAQPKTLISNLQYESIFSLGVAPEYSFIMKFVLFCPRYIQRFRNPDKMQGENGYYMSSLNAAISFIERMEHSVLSNITQSEFEYNVEQAIGRLPRSPVLERKSAAEGLPISVGGTTSKKGEGQAGENVGQLVGSRMPSTSLPDLTRSWLFTTVPQLAEKAVSKPLNAIARIVDDLASETEDGSQDSDRLRRASSSTLLEVEPSRHARGSRRGSRPWSADSPRSPSHDLHHPKRSSSSSGEKRNRLASSHEHATTLEDKDLQRIEQLKRAEHAAKLDTLAAIFPQLEPELLEVVLITHHGTISKAIDSLLDMS